MTDRADDNDAAYDGLGFVARWWLKANEAAGFAVRQELKSRGRLRVCECVQWLRAMKLTEREIVDLFSGMVELIEDDMESGMELRERWTHYCMKMECKACGEAIYAHEDDARADVEHILSTNDFGDDPPIDCLRDALTWFEHEGKWCDYHTEQMGKD